MNADMKWLDNPEVFKVNQLEPHSDHCYYLDYSDMKKEKNHKAIRKTVMPDSFCNPVAGCVPGHSICSGKRLQNRGYRVCRPCGGG